MHHDLKCVEPYFGYVMDGVKPFEIRKNDRLYQVNDTVTLHQYVDSRLTGRKSPTFSIGCITEYQQQPGYVVFALLENPPT